ncbi:MAG TPA: acylphosphatase [Chloroflexota bacterium]|nr:acylphosphatase [Chloroflexota bacterium]
MCGRTVRIDGRARYRVTIRGRVQGVSFRYYARQRATALGLSGWVRNRPDGTVEAVVEGDDEAVRRFLSWARSGPSLAEVTGVDLEPEEPRNEDSGFVIRG